MPQVGFQLKISAGERLQTYALDRSATGTGSLRFNVYFYHKKIRVEYFQTPPSSSLIRDGTNRRYTI